MMGGQIPSGRMPARGSTLSTGTAGRPTARFGRRSFGRLLASSATLTALGALAGCAPRPTTAQPPASLRVELPTTLIATAREWLTRALREEASGLGIRLDLTAGDPWTSLRRSTSSGAAASVRPDLILTPSTGPARLGYALGAADVNDLAERLIRRNGVITLRLRQTLTNEKRVWAVPFGATARIWLLRRDLAEARGVAAPNTYAEAVAAAMKLADPGRGVAGWAIPVVRSPESETLIAQAIVAYGGALASAGGQRPSLVSGESAEALGFLVGLAKKPDQRAALPADPMAWTGPGVDEAFFAGKVALGLVSAAAYASHRVASRGLASDTKLAAIAAPAGTKGRVTAADGYAFVVDRDATRPDLAADLLDRMLTPTRLRQLAMESGGAFVPAYADATHDPFWDSDPILAGIVQAVRGDASRQLDVVEPGFPGPASAGAAELTASLSLSAALARCVDDGSSVEESLKRAQVAAETLYDQVARELAGMRRRRTESE